MKPNLLPIRSNKRIPSQPNQTIKEFSSSLNSLSHKIDDLTQQFKNLPQRKSLTQRQQKIQHTAYNQRLQFRFKNVEIDIPNLMMMEDLQRKNSITIWLGHLCKKIFSVTFSGLMEGDLFEKIFKSYCSEQILHNVLNLIRKNQLSSEWVALINETLKNNLFPYFSLKYPLSQQAQVNSQITEIITPINNIEDNQNDLIYKSGINFVYKQDGNYNCQIMKFLNYIIQLPSKQAKNEKMSYSKLFFNDMDIIFKKVQDHVEMLKMKNYDIQKQDNSKAMADIQSFFQSTQKQKQQYKQKVKSYTSYLIGRKLSENTQTFSNKDIAAGQLNLKNSAIMRIITKWCEQLLKYLNKDYIVSRSQQFRLKNGSLRFLTAPHTELLGIILQKQKRTINENINQILKNNYQKQSQFGKLEVDDFMKIYSEQESIVGQFTSVIFMNNQNYLISYINMLIHHILKGIKDFAEVIKVQRAKNYAIEFSQEIQAVIDGDKNVQNLIRRAYDQKMMMDEDYINQMVPQLITFTIGDLLRCKCSSKQNQTIAIYRHLQKITHQNPEKLKIVRVKNRLQKGTKDVLINLLYRQTMLIEMQLQIKANKSKFIQFSSNFSHFLYELQRAQFGPISEMCSIWVNQDERSKFFMKIFKSTNTFKQISSKKHHIILNKKCVHKGSVPINLSFRCDQCLVYYPKLNLIEKAINCKQCNKNICLYCRIAQMTTDQIFKFIPELQTLKKKTSKETVFKRCTQDLPQFGALISLNSQQKIVNFFVKHKFDGKQCLFNEKKYTINKRTLKLNLLSRVSNPKKFLRENLVFTASQMKNLVPDISMNRAITEYFLPAQMYLYQTNKQNSINMVNKNIGQDFIRNLEENAQWKYAVKINFSQNNFEYLRTFMEDFPNIQTAVLNINKISDLSINRSNKHKWNKLKYLNLQKNNIQAIDNSFCELVSLQQLHLANNRISQLPQQMQNMIRLRIMNLNINSLTEVPIWFIKLKYLQELRLGMNQIEEIPDIFRQLKHLTQLFLQSNKLKSLPQSICQIQKLRVLYIYKNQIQSLPDNIGHLSNLEKLYANENKIKSFPSQLGSLKKIKKIFIDQNQIEELPESFGEILTLQKLLISYNKLKKIPNSFYKLFRLIQLNLSHNQLETFPQTFYQMENLQHLTFQSNNFSHLSEQFCKLIGLQKINAANNNIKYLPQNFGNLQNLKSIHFPNNKIENLPSSMQNLSQLFYVNFQGSLLTDISVLDGLELLQQININNTPIKHIPYRLKKLDILRMNNTQIEHLEADLSQLTSITQLYINSPRLTQIPQSFTNLHKLRVINLDSCRIKSLPQKIGQLCQVQSLFMQNNLLQILPDSFCNMLSLIQLNLMNNCLKYLPQNIGNLSNLVVMALVSNNLQKIPQSFVNLHKLNVISLSSNQLKQLPKNLNHLKNIQQIFLDNNQLTHLPDDFCLFSQATFINLDNNHLKELNPYFFEGMLSLQTLLLQQNQLQSLPSSINIAKNIHTIYMSNNQITTLPIQFYQLINLSILEISQNPLSQIDQKFKNLINLKQLYMVSTALKGICSNLDGLNIQLLNLQGNKSIQDKNNFSIGKLQRLSQLFLNNMGLQCVPKQMVELKSLILINFSENRIKDIPNDTVFPEFIHYIVICGNLLEQIPFCFSSLPYLKQLLLGDNKINKIDENIFGEDKFEALNHLDISDNQLSQLPTSLAKLLNLKAVVMSNNKLTNQNETIALLRQKGVVVNL